MFITVRLEKYVVWECIHYTHVRRVGCMGIYLLPSGVKSRMSRYVLITARLEELKVWKCVCYTQVERVGGLIIYLLHSSMTLIDE